MALRALSLCSKSSLVRILSSTSGEWAGDARAGANRPHLWLGPSWEQKLNLLPGHVEGRDAGMW